MNSSRTGNVNILYSLLLKCAPLAPQRFDAWRSFFVTLLGRVPLDFTIAGCYSSPEHGFYYAQVTIHFRGKQEGNTGILHLEVMTLSCIPLTYVFLRGADQVVQLLIKVVPGHPKGKAM